MNEIRTEIIINAPKEAIWDILTDFPAYPSWNPFIVKIAGKPKSGAIIRFSIRNKGMRLFIVARILAAEPGRKLSWGAPDIRLVKRIVDPEHYFIIEELEPGRCRLINGETMGGLLPSMAWPLIRRTRPAYEAMNEALKLRAEGRNRP